jgi:signal transduction histidine kinase/CheY-like chemotaxis protein
MPGPLPQVLRQLGFVLLEYRGHGRFAPLSPAPPWMAELWELPQVSSEEIPIGEKSPFLENFLFEANVFWNSNKQGLCRSETWVERSPTGKEMPLEAIALQWDGMRFLALHSPQPEFQERAELLQTARSSFLDHERLQREIQKKEILLHCIIHDLSQPLSVMSAALDCMTDEQIGERAKSLLQLGKTASDQQLSMIREILQAFSADLKASLDSGKSLASSTDISHCAKSVQKAFAPVYAAKNVKLLLEEKTDPGVKWSVRGESTRLERIFSNLLENALRYSPPGSAVRIDLAEEGEFVKASVDDEGCGLPVGMTPARTFALFSKGQEGGGKAGLGLYFCRLTVERWGGAISCESLPQRGSRFWFRLPKATAQAEATSHSNMPAAGKSPARRSGGPAPMPARKSPIRVLLADDQDEIRALTTLQLERRGHQVIAVANGQEALGALKRERFDVVLLDEDMPVLTGVQVVRAIRASQKDFAAVLVALTGYNSEPDQERLIQAGFDFVIGKPFRIDALDALLRGDIAEEPPCSGRTSDRPAAPRATEQSPMANLLDRVGGDEKLARQMTATFLRDTPKRIAGIQKALKAKNAQALASLAHALKGSVSIFDAEAALDFSQKLQDLGRANDFSGTAELYGQLKEEIAKLEANLRGYAGQNRSRTPGASPKTKRRTSTPRRKLR